MNQERLDDTAWIRQVDVSDMLGCIHEMPAHMREAARVTRSAGVTIDPLGLSHLIICGLGGSAVGGDLLRSLAGPSCSVAISVCRQYQLPAYVDHRACVLAVSYSGQTEETLSAYEDAKRRGATIIAITSGGELKRRAAADGVPTILVPGGLQPRAALGYLFIPQLLLVAGAGLLGERDQDAALAETVTLLSALREELHPEVPTSANEAKRLATALYGRIPLIHGAVGATEAVAYRWKTQINENAQSPAFSHVYPELNHNEIVGFDVPEDLIARLAVITLHSTDLHPQVTKRMQLTQSVVLASRAATTCSVQARGESHLAQLFSLLYLGDYVSTYLAVLYQRDPTPVDNIRLLKQQLAEG